MPLRRNQFSNLYAPKKKTYKKRKRNYKRKRVMKSVGIPQRGLRPAVHLFKRQMPHQVVDLDAEAIPGWNMAEAHNGIISKLWQFKLEDFANPGDFTNLFSYYKLTAVHLKIYQATSASGAIPRVNSQCILTIVPGRDGVETSRTAAGLESLQARKDRLLLNTTGKPHSVYMKLNQLSMIYGAPTVPASVTDYGLVKPRYISTTEPTTLHYGLWTYIRSVNSTSFDNIQLRIEPTIYLTCKQVE